MWLWITQHLENYRKNALPQNVISPLVPAAWFPILCILFTYFFIYLLIFSFALLPTTVLVLIYFNFAQLDKLFSFSEWCYQFSVLIIFSFFEALYVSLLVIKLLLLLLWHVLCFKFKLIHCFIYSCCNLLWLMLLSC